ncbi:hypothetical protein [Burkholderia multivorans]|uniref:hypothetical protein n=1 Tax=Burkholderia multivorans TaxID=87883 RepID=UPI0011B2964C|nr:hypothetical protein [Burkholderia multivorans]MBJ9942871.1 hypothetical protein [Burkholderia multivorans]MBR7893674.1 hypothetical protein [Burkholderia multivorans]MBR8454312.1 hypothetical protein [Burkholderia multivorans]MBU9450560.1 hypothetical protein [Burkholderia multivorans]MCL4645920.1 hypothetical protein [Burkholderia multivorans]
MHADRLAKSSVPSSDRGMQYRAAADVFSSGAAFRSLPTDGLVDVSTDGEAAANASTEKRYEGAFFFCAADARRRRFFEQPARRVLPVGRRFQCLVDRVAHRWIGRKAALSG